MVRVQAEPFDPAAELAAFARGRTDVGGIATFLGLVRDEHGGERVVGDDARALPRHDRAQAGRDRGRGAGPLARLQDTLVIHRHGRMLPGEPIVLVATASAHRQAALDACAFLIDWLKTKAPFWKLEETGGDERWVEARASDDAAAARWERQAP